MPAQEEHPERRIERYVLHDLMSEAGSIRLWRAMDEVLERPVTIRLIDRGDRRAEALCDAARRSAAASRCCFWLRYSSQAQLLLCLLLCVKPRLLLGRGKGVQGRVGERFTGSPQGNSAQNGSQALRAHSQGTPSHKAASRNQEQAEPPTHHGGRHKRRAATRPANQPNAPPPHQSEGPLGRQKGSTTSR